MITENLILGALGMAFGMVVAGGIFSFISSLGILSDFADRTHTGEYLLDYEMAAAFGGILGTAWMVYGFAIPIGIVGMSLFGMLSGMFVGCWAVALAEILNILPIFIRRTKAVNIVPWIMMAIAVGKGVGAFLYFYNRW